MRTECEFVRTSRPPAGQIMSPDPSKPSETVDSSVFERLQARLAAACVAFNVLRHGPVTTSEEAALVRGTSLASGAKALLLMLDGRPELFVLPADRKLDSRKLRKSLSVRSLRFASVDEVVAITRLRPGAVPPFGSLFGL